jgi:hypothetical protein
MQKTCWSPNFRGTSAGNFLNPLNSGFRYFLREGKFRNRARTEFIILGRRQRAKGHLTLTYSFNQLFSWTFYTKGVHIFSKGVSTKGVHILLLFLLSPFQERMDRFSIKNGNAKTRGAIWRFL